MLNTSLDDVCFTNTITKYVIMILSIELSVGYYDWRREIKNRAF